MMLEDGEGTPERGAYETWRSLDPWHVAFMNVLSAHVRDEPEARLWFAVLEQALIDHFVLKGRDMDPEDWRMFAGGWCKAWLFRRPAEVVCEAIGIDPAWFRARLRQYADTRQAPPKVEVV
jgi:hypothetical protein